MRRSALGPMLTILSLLAVAGAGCSTSPLVGTWSRETAGSSPDETITRELVLTADGQALFHFVGGGACSGTVSYRDFTWSEVENPSGGRAIRFAGDATCDGEVQCGSGRSGCSDLVVATVGTCPYVLGGGDDMLRLTNCFGAVSTDDVFRRR